MASQVNVPLDEASLNIVRQCEFELRDILQFKFGCAVASRCFEEGPRVARQRRPAVAPEKRFETVLRSGVKVTVWKADLTNFSAAAVVNAANEFLQHGGGLAGALSLAGGPKIQYDSNEYIKKNGPLNTGDAIVSDAGLLRCQKIIHAVGPNLPHSASSSVVKKAKPLLERTINNILNRVKENRLDNVAIPAISSGLFNYPLPECAHTIVTAVKEYFEYSSPRDYSPKEVLFVNNDELTVAQMQKACHTILGNATMTYSQAAANHSRGTAKTTATTVEMGNLCVILKKGKIEEQRTDVIVNSTSSDRKLETGHISRALLQKAGDEMQREIYRARTQGSIIITRGFKLQCKEVFHTTIDTLGKGLGQNLSTSVRECLWMATTLKHRSISFPAIATGNLGLSKSRAAQIMLDEMTTFAKSLQMPMEVHLVIFPSDEETFKAFESQMKVLQNKASDFKFSQVITVRHGEGSSENFEYTQQHSSPEQQVWRNKDEFDVSRASTPQISLCGPSDEMTQEAQLWLCGILNNPSNIASICNNFIQYFDEEDFCRLSHQRSQGLQIEEFLQKGRAGIIINGGSAEDLAVFTIQVEAVLCRIQKDFVAEEVGAIRDLLPNTRVTFERKTLDKYSSEFKRISSTFKHQHLYVQKVEEVENAALTLLFEMKKNQLSCSTTRPMLQRLHAPFCEMVSHVGCHAECAPPDDPSCGKGIYFAGSVQKAMDMWKGWSEKYLYFVEAEVIAGKSTPGEPGLILPPPLGSDPHARYDSVSEGADTVVIFSSYQALPKYIITCKAP